VKESPAILMATTRKMRMTAIPPFRSFRLTGPCATGGPFAIHRVGLIWPMFSPSQDRPSIERSAVKAPHGGRYVVFDLDPNYPVSTISKLSRVMSSESNAVCGPFDRKIQAELL
jgi:hypothetical protein